MKFEKTIPLNEFITLQRGFDLPKSDRKNGNVPVVASTGIGGYHNEAKVEAPGVVIGRSGSIGGGQFITENFWPLNTTLWVKDFKGHHSRYVYYLLKSIDFKKFNVGSGVPTLNRNHLSSILVSDIGISSEKKIAQVLGSLDDKIALNTQINQTLEAMAQAIFKSWFVDFEPVKAKIAAIEAGEDPESVNRAAMRAISGRSDEGLDKMQAEQPEEYAQLKGTAELFPAAMWDSELGEVPEGWGVSPLGNYLTIKRGGSPRPIRDFIVPTGLPWVKIADATAQSSPFLFKTKEFIKPEGIKKTVLLKKGSLILSNSATPGLPKFLDLNACIHDGWLHFPEKKLYSNVYLYHLFLELKTKLIAQGNGSVFTNLKTDILRNQVVVAPTKEMINRFDISVELIFKKLRESCEEINSLSNLRDTLLPKLLSGELSVENIKLDEADA